MITVEYVGNYEPVRGSKCAAGYDLRACLDGREKVLVRPGEYVSVSTGIRAQPPVEYAGLLMGRSGISKRGLRLSTGVSLIDPDFCGEIVCLMYNDSFVDQYIYDGERIAQIVYIKFAEVNWQNVPQLHKTERGDGGFGSTGK